MKRQIGIWLNASKAVMVDLTDGAETVRTFESEVESRNRFPGEGRNYSGTGAKPTNPDQRMANRKKHQLNHFFEDIKSSIGDSKFIYLLGPSNTKKMLEKELKKHHTFDAARIDLENADKLTQNQLVAKVKEHFNNIKS